MELQLHVCDNEYKSFQNDHLRDLWPAVGAYCNIEECGKNQFFRSFNEYKSHFGSVHKEKLTLYTCQICDLSRRKLQDVLPYRVGDVKEREEAKQTREKVEERKRKAKEEAQETRKRYVNSGKKPKVEDTHYNSRDEHLKFNFDKNTLTRTVIKAKKKTLTLSDQFLFIFRLYIYGYFDAYFFKIF
ncbi:Hypothetical predicted protein [Mytilus galloprovincialis]|uniref:Uncharacterized protein n=1 Tax=Mytilus galloprovincialis TaxID=29158 RepID=A0A8B6BH38_MYTGA|nr:Hypothetical predicted protein [Mytilus galloprovincialis]